MPVRKCMCFTKQQSLKLLNLVIITEITLLGFMGTFQSVLAIIKQVFYCRGRVFCLWQCLLSHCDKHQNAEMVLKRLTQKHSSCYLAIQEIGLTLMASIKSIGDLHNIAVGITWVHLNSPRSWFGQTDVASGILITQQGFLNNVIITCVAIFPSRRLSCWISALSKMPDVENMPELPR